MLENLIYRSRISVNDRISKHQFQRNFGSLGIGVLLISIASILLYSIYGISDNIILIILYSIFIFVVSAIAILLFFLFIGVSILGTVGRLHDMNRSGWWYFAGFIPLLGLALPFVLFFSEGDKTSNYYGEVPKEHKFPNDKLVRIWGVVFYFFFIVLLSIGSALSDYSDETKYTPSKLSSEVASLNKSINPNDIEDPHIIKYESNGMNMIYHFQYNNPASDYDFSDVRANLLRAACDDSDVKSFMLQGVNLEYIFKDSLGETVIDEIITIRDCKI